MKKKTCVLISHANVRNKLIFFTANTFQLEGDGFEKTIKKILRTEKMWKTLIEPGLKKASPVFSAGVAAKTINPQSAEITSKI